MHACICCRVVLVPATRACVRARRGGCIHGLICRNPERLWQRDCGVMAMATPHLFFACTDRTHFRRVPSPLAAPSAPCMHSSQPPHLHAACMQEALDEMQLGAQHARGGHAERQRRGSGGSQPSSPPHALRGKQQQQAQHGKPRAARRSGSKKLQQQAQKRQIVAPKVRRRKALKPGGRCRVPTAFSIHQCTRQGFDWPCSPPPPCSWAPTLCADLLSRLLSTSFTPFACGIIQIPARVRDPRFLVAGKPL